MARGSAKWCSQTWRNLNCRELRGLDAQFGEAAELGHHFAHRNGYALSEQHCWYHPKDLIQNSGSPTKRLFWDHWYERRTLLSWFMFSSCMNLIVRSLFGKLLFRILKIESCLHVDTLGVLVWFKCVRIYEYRYMYTYHHLQVWVPSLKKT